ncbi:MAG TPA: MATE family efflux transporter [Microscillaceae bacterium]|nr:MATE family efflux transporter [Microscillaceae bacterium]
MDTSNNQKEFILKEDLTKVMWKLSLPAIAAMVLFGLNAFLDTVFVGQLINETALAGVALAYPLTSIMFGIGSLAGTGAASALSIALGANDATTQKKLLGNATLMMLVSTAIFAIPAYIFAESLIQMMGGKGAILQEGVRYFKVTLLGSFFWIYGLGLNFIIRGEGKMKQAAIMMIYGLALNIILNPIFIKVLGWGVEGAAWATNIGMILYCIIEYWYFVKGKASFEAQIQVIRYDKAVFRSIVSMGMPGFIMSLMGLVQAIVVFNALSNYGTERDLAFFAAANRLMLFLMTPLFGLMRAMQPVTGISFGAGNYDRVKRSFIVFSKTGFYIVAPFWLLLTLFPSGALHLVLPKMVFTASELFNFRVYMAVLPVLPVVFMALTFFPSINEGKYGSIIGLARQLVFYVPIMLILPRLFGIQWIYVGATLIDIILTLWVLAIVRQLFKKLIPNTKQVLAVSQEEAL